MFRYGASLENYTAMLLLCTFMGWSYLAPANRFCSFCIVVCSWLLVVGGHPQMMYIGFLGAGFACIFLPFYLSCLLPEESPLSIKRVLKYWCRTGFFAAMGILLASIYILPFYFEYLKQSQRGYTGDFAWSCGYQETVNGSLCNFFNPFFSDVCGAFGGSSLILPAMLLPLTGVFYIRRSWPVLSLWAGCAIVLVMTLGSNGHLYYYFWKYFPFAQTFRIPSRLSMVLPFIFMLILVWMVQQKTVHLRAGKHQLSFDPVAMAASVALILFIVPKNFDYSTLMQAGRWVPARINKIPSIAVSTFFVCGVISLGALIIYRVSKKLRTLSGIVLALAVLTGVTVAMGYGTWVAGGRVRTKTFENMQAEQRLSLAYRYSTGDWTHRTVEEHLKHTFLEPLLARVCRKYQPVGSQNESYECLAKQREIDLVYVEGWSDGNKKEEIANLDKGINKVTLRYNSFNNVKFDVECAGEGFFVLSYPYSEYWQAYVDNERVSVYRCNGIEQGIWVKGGRHTVEFRYFSWPAVTGVMLGCTAAFLTALILIMNVRPRLLCYLLMVAVICICVLLFWGWYYSLYNGCNIGTHYAWTSEEVQPHLLSYYNLAYGKPTTMSMPGGGRESYFTDSSVGVDGDRRGNTGFVTNIQEHAWWQVDLCKDETVNEIVLYKRAGGYAGYGVPFDIFASADGKKWFLIQAVEKNNNENCWRVQTKNVVARYIKLQTRYYGCLALAEVEIYGPQGAK